MSVNTRSAFGDLLCKLQFKVAEELLFKLETGEADSKDIANILKMLKDNNVQYDSEILKSKLSESEKKLLEAHMNKVNKEQEVKLRKLPDHLKDVI